MTKFKESIPRHMYYSFELRNWKNCPKCGSSLEKEQHTYSIVILKSRNKQDQFVMGTDAGHFCLNCPVVVLDADKSLKLILEAVGNFPIVIEGIANLENVPEELNFSEAPPPVVEFINYSDSEAHENFLDDKSVMLPVPTKEEHVHCHKEIRKRKLGRNDPCYCGSGKKYKKCCLQKYGENK